MHVTKDTGHHKIAGDVDVGMIPHKFHVPKPTETKKMMSSQYDPLPWSDFFDTKEMLDGTVPIYQAGN